MNLPTPAVLADYRISLFKADDAAQILRKTLRKTDKPTRVTADLAASALNSGIRRCIGGIGLAMESTASEHAVWAAQLTEALQRGLSLLAPGSTATHAPINSNLIDAYARLFNAGIPPEVDGLLGRYGFKSPQQALEMGVIGLWIIHAFAVHSGAEWQKKVRPRDDMNRRGPDAALVVWVRVMGNLYSSLVGATPPREPIGDSPFIRFCNGVRTHVLQRCAPSDESNMRAFLAVLRGADPERLAAFMRRNKNRFRWDASPTKQVAAAR